MHESLDARRTTDIPTHANPNQKTTRQVKDSVLEVGLEGAQHLTTAVAGSLSLGGALAGFAGSCYYSEADGVWDVCIVGLWLLCCVCFGGRLGWLWGVGSITNDNTQKQNHTPTCTHTYI